jgi:hypothetical protein
MKILAIFLISAFAFATPALAEYDLSGGSRPEEIVGKRTRVFDCTYRGSDRREGCL